MKQNSAKPTTTVPPYKGSCATMQRVHHHQHPMSFHQQQMQPGTVTFQQQQPSYQPAVPQHHPHLQQQQTGGCIVLPSGMMHQQPQHTYMAPQPGQLSSVGPMYAGSAMVQLTSPQPGPAGFSTSAQPSVGYLHAAHHQPSMVQVQQRLPNYQPTVADFVASNAVTTGYSGAHQPHKQHQQQQQHQPSQSMQSYQEALTTATPPSYPIHMQSSSSSSSHHPEGSTTEAHYFFDANCTMPVVQQPPSTVPGCRNPKCTSCKSFQHN